MQAAAHGITPDEVIHLGMTYLNDAKSFIAAFNAAMGLLSQPAHPIVPAS